MGTVWSFHLPVVTALLRTWGFPSFDLFVSGLPVVLPLFCSLVLNHRVVFLDVFRVHWAALGLYAFRPSFRQIGGWLESERPFSPELWFPRPPLIEVGVVRGPSLPLLVVFTGSLPSWQGVSVSPVSGSQSALNSVMALQDLVHTLYRRYFYVPWKFLGACRTCGVAFPPGVVALVPQGLAQGLCVPFGLRLGGVLPGHRSSSWPLPSLETPAYSTSFVSSLSLQS